MDHLLKEIYCLVIEILTQLPNVFCGVTVPLGECHFHLGKICKALPSVFARSSESLENLKDLSNLRVTSKERLFVSELEEDSSD